MKLEWSDSLSVGVPQMDEQHRKLVEILNRFYEAVEKGERDEAIEMLLKGAEEYTVFHFQSEENFMEEIGFPELEAHRKAHQNLVNEVRMAKEKHARGDRKAVRGLAAFLLSWLYTHIAKTDRKYGEFYTAGKK